MHIEDLRLYCLSKPGVTDSFPFDESTLVFKVLHKMFAATSIDREVFTVNLKCDPEWALTLREEHTQIQPGYHMNKKHWNTVNFEEGLEEGILKELIDHSYDLVVSGMSRKKKEELALLNDSK